MQARDDRQDVALIGAGIGGLAAAGWLVAAGRDVTVFERHGHPGGKLRALPSPAGPVDAGPTVLTLRDVFDDLFAALGTRLEKHLALARLPVIARHFWPDGGRLDLTGDTGRDAEAIGRFAGSEAAREFRAFDTAARRLYAAFDAPVMRAPRPDRARIMAAIARTPRLLADLAPGATLDARLKARFDDPRLVQLFGRYATYVGGNPLHAPALLALIWRAEAEGVWAVEGGLWRLAAVLHELLAARGVRFRFETDVAAIETDAHGVAGLRLADGTRIAARSVLFNGDPRALATGALGPNVAHLAAEAARSRSLSAHVWSFAARAAGPELARHNVFFTADGRAEFAALTAGRTPADPSLYLCAQDRGTGPAPAGPERFEIIANAPPAGATRAPGEGQTCPTRSIETLARFGLRLDPAPGPMAPTRPGDFAEMFPASLGALYGQSPDALTAAFRRPTARTAVPGLYLAGGGVHPGPGLPMAALSGRHAAEAMLSDRTSRSRSRPGDTAGGISTRSATTAAAPSRRSAS